jgi:hypothetical protein
MGPERIHHLLSVQPMAGRYGKELEDIGAAPVTPRHDRHRASVDLDLEPP